MNISGIRPSFGFYNYNHIAQTSDVTSNQDVTTTGEANAKESVANVASAPARDENREAEQAFGAYDFASQYNPDATYSLKGDESDIHSLDVEKAVSDMRKDEVLHQYQYFVGETMGADVDAGITPSMRGAEDFSL